MPTSGPPQPCTLRAPGPLVGRVEVPGDKSISHRALMLGALAVGTSTFTGLLEGEDVLATAAALRALGASVRRLGPGHWQVDGVGVGGLLQPEGALDLGNSGTSARLLMGLAAGHDFLATFVGDASLSRRPMARVIEPLARMGADILAAPGMRLPATVRGLCPALPLEYRLPVASAQVKSAILLAGLHALGATTVVEPLPTRDHTERLLAAMGADLSVVPTADGGRAVRVHGFPELRPQRLEIPADPSSAAFPLVAALLVPGSEVHLPGVGLNPTRDGALRTLLAMGADVRIRERREVGGEPVGDLFVRSSALHAVDTAPEDVPAMIDEFPILFVAAALARGRSLFRGLGELRVKESDRLAAMASGLTACGVKVEEFPDGLAVHGSGGAPVPGGAWVDVRMDHRIAMSFLVLSLAAREPITVSDVGPIATSFPGFVSVMEALGACALGPGSAPVAP
ncbi:MAG: 3-phosphoshikimate 1-carboxyvinyltransferase [Sphingomonadaceae bacterium]|uniref:3-phosphoshikimate 1-carboxyvinyltransferase n=1 Tax=Thermaurantiacus sp. TaxID=2820283 RepID=UPI00298F27A4|nr:3-phosphoshikimate 1-carboxyvinyltransferase [Thermaurantiacus sp.]MCS6987727.1 3-phosphoshikimate 1-carboxyvinyltransferase [Sphingomonadaceae bacterium]MDW8415053.1 3-phosphoshikimate 1-carboxyvinyltransferase [Thermaurantiacus sp.]